jgi:hypothetical protein
VSGQDAIVMFAMMTVASVVGAKFKTRQKAAAWFDSLKLDRVSGFGLAFVIVAAAMLVAAFAGNHSFVVTR